MYDDLKGKRVLITGSSSKIGISIAELFIKCGANVGLHYNKNEEIMKNVFGKYTNNPKYILLRHDLLDSSQYDKLIKSFIEHFGGIDILINNAGNIYGYRSFLELDEESWDNTFSLNVKAPFFISQKVFPYMKKCGGGKIINISSISAKYGGSEKTMHYGASKSALDTLSIGFAKRGAQYNILVNSIRCGYIDTDIHTKIGRSEEDKKKRINMIPLRRAGKPIDIARMVLFLSSESGNFITGEIFTIAGGD